MRSYKKIKKITNLHNISPQSKGVIIVAEYANLANALTNNVAEIKNLDGTTLTYSFTLYPAEFSGGVTTIAEDVSSYSILPFKLKGITLDSSGTISVYELY